MGGYFPGVPGLIAFAGVKFGGYCLAGVALKKLQPAITASVAKIAGARTGLGILIGPVAMLGLGFALALAFPQAGQQDFSNYISYGLLYVVRIVIWAFVIHLFTQEIRLPKAKLWSYAALGAVWSCLLDLPGVGLAVVAPGKVPIC
jgi:hypothetical protein